MPIYFYTCKNDEIQALCGVKAIVIPAETANKLKERLDNIEQTKLSEKTLKEEFNRCLEEEFVSDELKEEYNHFKCLVHSKAAKLFYVRNFLLRLAYASYTRKRIIRPNVSPHPIFRDVLKYFIDYTFFHYAACPFIEGHAFFAAGKEQPEKGKDPLYWERIKIARTFLYEYLKNLKNNDSYRRVGELVDRNFFLLLRQPGETFAKLEYEPTIDQIYLKKFNTYFWLHRMFGGLIKQPRLWINLGRAVLSKIKLVIPNIKNRFFPGSADSSHSPLLPTIIADKITIDPMMAFAYGKQSMHSHKRYYPAPLNGGLANMLWHILGRCAVIASFISLDMPEKNINKFFKNFIQFNKKWRSSAKDAEFQLRLLDTVIIEKLTEQYSKGTQHSPWDKIFCLERIALDIFKEFRGNSFFNLHDSSSPLNVALNCSYMHI
jgi:hypothetical protein